MLANLERINIGILTLVKLMNFETQTLLDSSC